MSRRRATAWLRSTAVGTLLVAIAPPLAAQTRFVIRDVRVFDGERTLEHRSILVDAGRIAAIGDANLNAPAPPPPPPLVIDGRGRTLLPGLIDSHVHVADDVHAALRQALVLGVTTELDMFSGGARLGKMKEVRASDPPDIADIRTAGVGATAPGGHPTQMGGGPIPTLTNPAEAKAWVDARIAEGSDYIKIIRDDLRWMVPKGAPTLDSATIAAVVRAAHARRKLAVVHISNEADARMVLAAGADGLAHIFTGDSTSHDFGTFAAAHHAFVIPTLETMYATCGRFDGPSILADTNLGPFVSEPWRQMLAMTWQPGKISCAASDEAVRQLAAAHVPILAGTDAPIPSTAYGASLHGELALLVHAGLTPEQALTAATSGPARIFHLEDRGAIRPGLRADLLLVEGDPTHDILATRRIVAVWKRGIRVDRAGEQSTHADSLIGHLVGHWQMRGQVRGKPVAYDATGARTLGGRFVELHMNGSAGGEPYEARVFVGVDTAADRIDVHWMDTWGAAFSVPAATGYARGDTLRFDFLYSDGPFRDTFVWQPAERGWHMVLEKSDGRGGWNLFADFLATRQ